MRFHITTLGCPKNSVDSEMMAELLSQAGHVLVDRESRADLLIVNTCGFIEPARDESLGVLADVAAHKRKRQRLIAAGCLAQRYADDIQRLVPQVDAVIGTRSWPAIVKLVNQLQARPRESLNMVEARGNLVASAQRFAVGPSAYLKIADGCDASCAFCAIPGIKGPQQSKPPADVLREAVELLEQDVQEIVLIAQDTTAYGRDLRRSGDADERLALPALMRAICAQSPELPWLRVLYAYPQHIDNDLVTAMAELPQVCHYLDLPLQHGHPDVLQRMRRPHDVDDILRTVDLLRQAMPDIALRSTFIVGYPGETEREFEALLQFMQEIAFDKVGIFAYSSEEGTPAADLPDHVPAEVIAERYDRAMMAQQEISLERNLSQVGRELEVLIEGVGDGISVGRSYRDAPEIDGLVLIAEELPVGEFVPTRIVQAQEYDLVAEVLADTD